ncbi:hypothetical protein EE612_054995, partial [Oryza sativa]
FCPANANSLLFHLSGSIPQVGC